MKLQSKYIPLAATISLFAAMSVFGAVSYTGFLSPQVFLNLLIDNAFLVIVAVGMTFVILSGGIDLSVGSVVALSTIVLLFGLRHLPAIMLTDLALALHAGGTPLSALGSAIVIGRNGEAAGVQPTLPLRWPASLRQRTLIWIRCGTHAFRWAWSLRGRTYG